MIKQYDPEVVDLGRSIAQQLAQRHEAGEVRSLTKYRASLSADDLAALDVFREYQIANLISQIEESSAGARIRHEEASAAYRQLVAKEFQNVINGASK